VDSYLWINVCDFLDIGCCTSDVLVSAPLEEGSIEAFLMKIKMRMKIKNAGL